MPKTHLHIVHRTLSRLTMSLGALCLVIIAGAVWQHPETVLGRLIQKAPVTPWVFISQAQIDSGAIVPANTNVVFQIPDDVQQINREVLLGQKGASTRYWGYCFPQNDDPRIVATRTGFKGLIFLSEKEQAERAAQAQSQAAQQAIQLSPFSPPSKAQLRAITQQAQTGSTLIHNQIELFVADEMCYLMTEDTLAIGADPDGDGLNNMLETELGTDPHNPDTDGDGLPDGIEFKEHTNPLLRDSDGDGLIDGFEDKNANGRMDPGETNPLNRDTDGDGLCDGLCRIQLPNGKILYAGEDKNLNGQLDAGESDPTKVDSLGDGIDDYTRFLQCVATGKSSC